MILKLIVLAGIILVIIAFNDSSDVQRSQEAERQRLAEEEAALQEAERQRLAQEEAARQEAERQRLAQEEASRQAAERQRLAEEEAARQAAERQRLAEEEAARQAAERQRLAEEEAARQAAERQRLAQEEASRQAAERQRLAEEEAARQEAERQRLADEEAARQAAERQRLAQEEASRQAAERSQLTPEERKRLAREELELKLGRRPSVQEGKHQETKYQYLAEEALAAKARLADAERQILAEKEAIRQAAERQRLVQAAAPHQETERKRLAREELEVLARRQRQGQEAGNQLTLEEDFPILTEQWYKNLVAFEDTYYADIVTRDLRAIENGEETLSYSVTGLVAKLLRTNDRRAAMSLQESVNDYTESRPQASLSERREAIINPENQEYWSDGYDLRLQGTCNYFLESNRDVEVFYNGRKPKNGRRLVLVEQVKGQLKYFGFDEADVTSVIEDPAYGQIVYVAFVKNAGYELVYQTTYYDRIMHLSEDMRDYLVSPNQSVLRRQSGLGRVALSSPSSQGQEPWRNKVEQAVKKNKVPVIRNGQLTKPIDWLTEPSLPVFSGIDVNRFQNDIETLANIMMIVGKYFIGFPAGDWIRYINEKCFGRKRLTEGYKLIYRQALIYLEKEGLIQIKSGIVSFVSDGRDEKADDSTWAVDIFDFQHRNVWRIGELVRHGRWGLGRIVDIRKTNYVEELTIDFPNRGIKQVIAHLEQLEKAD